MKKLRGEITLVVLSIVAILTMAGMGAVAVVDSKNTQEEVGGE